MRASTPGLSGTWAVIVASPRGAAVPATNCAVTVAAAGFDSARSCTLETPSASTSFAETIAVAAALWLTAVPVLWIVGAVAVYRTGWMQPGPGHPPTAATFVALLLALSWFARTLH